jgi:hypothetical protein
MSDQLSVGNAVRLLGRRGLRAAYVSLHTRGTIVSIGKQRVRVAWDHGQTKNHMAKDLQLISLPADGADSSREASPEAVNGN